MSYIIRLFIIIIYLFAWQQKGYAAGNESSAGIVIDMFQPDYGKFTSLVSAKGEPPFPSQIMLVGGDATFMRKGFITGGRVVYGSTKTQATNSASYYSVGTIGLKAGYGFDLGVVDFDLMNFFGIGNVNYTSATTTEGGVVDVSYLFLEPGVMIGLAKSSSFKVSIGGGYQYAIIYNVNMYGKQLLSDPAQATAGGVSIIIQLSFGTFGK